MASYTYCDRCGSLVSVCGVIAVTGNPDGAYAGYCVATDVVWWVRFGCLSGAAIPEFYLCEHPVVCWGEIFMFPCSTNVALCVNWSVWSGTEYSHESFPGFASVGSMFEVPVCEASVEGSGAVYAVAGVDPCPGCDWVGDVLGSLVSG